MKVAFLTCADKPDFTFGDRKVAHYLQLLGVQVEPLPWGRSAQGFDLLVVRSAWDYHHRPAEFLRWLEESRVPVLNPLEMIRWNSDKRYLLDIKAQRLPVVPALFFKRSELALIEPRLKETGWPEIVIKPGVSASAHRTFRLRTAKLSHHWQDLLDITESGHEVLIQPYRPEIESQGEASFMFFKKKGKPPQLSHAVLKRPPEGDFRVQQGTVEPHSPSLMQLRQAANYVAGLRGEWLFARVDLLLSPEQPELMELELIEPELFFDQEDANLPDFAESLISHFAGNRNAGH